MNVTFHLPDPALDAPFLEGAKAAGLLNLKGHRVVGGMRASIYNAMPIEGVARPGRLPARFRGPPRLKRAAAPPGVRGLEYAAKVCMIHAY